MPLPIVLLPFRFKSLLVVCQCTYNFEFCLGTNRGLDGAPGFLYPNPRVMQRVVRSSFISGCLDTLARAVHNLEDASSIGEALNCLLSQCLEVSLVPRDKRKNVRKKLKNRLQKSAKERHLSDVSYYKRSPKNNKVWK